MSGDTFYLMRRDIPVMCFDAPNYRVSGIKEIFEPDILPVGAGRDGLHFADWLSFRMILLPESHFFVIFRERVF